MVHNGYSHWKYTINEHTAFYISLSHSTAWLRLCGLLMRLNTPHLIRETSRMKVVFFSCQQLLSFVLKICLYLGWNWHIVDYGSNRHIDLMKLNFCF